MARKPSANEIAASPFLRRHRREAEMIALGVFLAGAGVLAALVLSTRDNQGIEIVGSNDVVPAKAGTYIDSGSQAGMTVDVAGAVIRPGVYRLPAGSRFADALAAAGGLSAAADRNWVSRHLNLAQNITDGAKIYIPAAGENFSEVAGGQNSPNPPNSPTVSINNASLNELDTLWGVGESRAQAIISGRPYASIEELVTRKILPQNVMERNRDKLRL